MEELRVREVQLRLLIAGAKATLRNGDEFISKEVIENDIRMFEENLAIIQKAIKILEEMA